MNAPLDRHIVVVGAGQAAAQLIEALREGGHCGRITLVGDEPYLPYQRPPLSKQYLAGSVDTDWLAYRPTDFYAKHAVTAELGQRAVAIDRARQRLCLDDSRELPYDALALTTGTRARRLPHPGGEPPGLHYLRTLADADALKASLAGARRVVIVGGGFIGLEVAAVLAKLGRDVTVLEAAPTLMPRVVAPELSQFLVQQHAAHGVRIVTGVKVAQIEARRGTHRLAVVADQVFEADAVIVGIGALPNAELAQDAGLACNDGIVVDAAARSSDPAIVAAGDCTRHPSRLYGRELRLETVHNAVEQAKVAAATLCGEAAQYDQAPWVWSDQYGFRFHAVGAIDGYDRHVIRGDIASGRFAVCYFRAGRLLALHSINRPLEFAGARRLLNSGSGLSPEQAADPGFDLAGQARPGTRLDFDPPWPLRGSAPASTGAPTRVAAGGATR